MAEIFIRSPWNYNRNEASEAVALLCDPAEEMTQQQFIEECDINTLVKRFGLTGQLPTDLAVPISGDFTGATDFETSMNVVRQAQEAFMELPPDVRFRFANDPGRLIAFLENEDNRDEARKLGIIPPPPERTRDVVQAVDELAAKWQNIEVPSGTPRK